MHALTSEKDATVVSLQDKLRSAEWSYDRLKEESAYEMRKAVERNATIEDLDREGRKLNKNIEDLNSDKRKLEFEAKNIRLAKEKMQEKIGQLEFDLEITTEERD